MGTVSDFTYSPFLNKVLALATQWSAHILPEDGYCGRDGLVGVVEDGAVVSVDGLILEHAIGKITYISEK
jgi:hypothetical protein